jgi:pimeloyl-ACP methyl ester carboxylesterase
VRWWRAARKEIVMTATPDPQTPDTIVLVHGLWLTPRSWEHWIERYSSRGYKVLAPAWPGMEVEVEALRRDPSVMDGLGVTEVADHYEKIIRGLGKPTVIIGHSFGGLLTQILIDRGLGAAGLAIDSAPVKGVLRLPPSSLRSAFPGLRNPANRHRTVALTAKQWHYRFTNTLDEDESRALYDRYYVPGPGRPMWQVATANFNSNAATKVDLGNDTRAPLLLIAGGADHVAPPASNRENHKRYRKSTATTEYKEFPGRPHFTGGVPGWEQVADYALSWAIRHGASDQATHGTTPVG